MAQGYGKRQRPPLPVVALILLMCIVTGLIAGAGTRRLVASVVLRGSGTPLAVGTGLPANHETATTTPDPSPSTTNTPTSAPSSGLASFSLQVLVLPASVSAGQHFTVTATVLAKGGPIEGVSCTIGSGGGTQLFTAWPAAVVSNTAGIAAWTLKAPSVTPGTYQMKVQCTGSDNYRYWAYASIGIAVA